MNGCQHPPRLVFLRELSGRLHHASLVGCDNLRLVKQGSESARNVAGDSTASGSPVV